MDVRAVRESGVRKRAKKDGREGGGTRIRIRIYGVAMCLWLAI